MLITPQGEYIQTTFTGSNGTWRLIGSESSAENSKPMDTVDTFTNGKGQYNTLARRKVADLFKQQKIFL